jgi:excisionase family DNA binding protein
MMNSLTERRSTGPRPLATRPEVAQYLGVPISTLERWARLKVGPTYRRVGRHTRYRWTDVEAWVEDQQGTTA